MILASQWGPWEFQSKHKKSNCDSKGAYYTDAGDSNIN